MLSGVLYLGRKGQGNLFWVRDAAPQKNQSGSRGCRETVGGRVGREELICQRGPPNAGRGPNPQGPDPGNSGVTSSNWDLGSPLLG